MIAFCRSCHRVLTRVKKLKGKAECCQGWNCLVRISEEEANALRKKIQGK